MSKIVSVKLEKTTTKEVYMKNKLTNKELKEAIRTKYAWPGGYELFGITNDGVILCCDCMKKNFRNVLEDRRDNTHSDWNVVAIDMSCNLEHTDYVNEHPEEFSLSHCENCNKVLNS
jgi:hypothetical protein